MVHPQSSERASFEQHNAVYCSILYHNTCCAANLHPSLPNPNAPLLSAYPQVMKGSGRSTVSLSHKWGTSIILLFGGSTMWMALHDMLGDESPFKGLESSMNDGYMVINIMGWYLRNMAHAISTAESMRCRAAQLCLVQYRAACLFVREKRLLMQSLIPPLRMHALC